MEGIATSVPPIVFLAGFMVMSSLVSQVIDSSVAVIFLGPLAIAFGQHHGGSPYALLLAVTFGSSLAFVLPTSCRSNLLVSGVGGYKSSDFAKIGLPFTFIIGAVLLIALLLVDT